MKTEIINQPPRPQINFAINKPALYCGHPSFKRLIFIHIFFVNFLLWEGDPSFLQTSASSGVSEFGMTLYFLGHGRKKRRFATTFY